MDEISIKIPDSLRDEKARAMYGALCDEYLRAHGVEEIPDSSLSLISDVCMMEPGQGQAPGGDRKARPGGACAQRTAGVLEAQRRDRRIQSPQR